MAKLLRNNGWVISEIATAQFFQSIAKYQSWDSVGALRIEKKEPKFDIVLLSCRKILKERVKLEVSLPINLDIFYYCINPQGEKDSINDIWMLLLDNTIGLKEQIKRNTFTNNLILRLIDTLII